MKRKKKKEMIDFVIEEMANSITVYLHADDEVGACGYCNEISYKPHEEGCPVRAARKLLKWKDY